ncbi:hypothetical protein [Pseudosulfitobacter sp. SM2401]|uniref:hypothetical protein n=1 Tax=Pseudosulfitobacter sp. SM2401 TaxID=3350098 RepID=UPI0036F1E061
MRKPKTTAVWFSFRRATFILFGMYQADSFFTLSITDQIFLGWLSLILFSGAIWAMTRVKGMWALRLLIALLSFWLFVWLSPQIYYLYYIMIIDGLPVQWVIRTAPSPVHIIQLLTFWTNDTLSAHSQGVLGWAMIAAAAIRR